MEVIQLEVIMPLILHSFAFALLLSISTLASAEAEMDKPQTSNILASKSVQLGIRTGFSNVTAHEFVYAENYKVSELLWDTENAPMIATDFSFILVPSWDLKFNATLSTIIGTPDSTMNDYDWLVVGADWSDWSTHDNTQLKRGLNADISISSSLYSNESETIVLDILLGYKRDQWKWEASGGSYIYTLTPGFRDQTGTFANTPVTSYQQTIDTPYIGMSAIWTEGKFTIGIKVIVSKFAFAKAVDHHYLRNLVFTDTFKNGTMIGGDVHFTYQATKNTTYNIFYAFQSYPKNRGNTSVFNQTTGITTNFYDAAGMSLDYQTLGIGATYAF